MDELMVELSIRDLTGKKVKALRREGRVPAVLYGPEMEPVPVLLDHHTASRVLQQVTASSLVKVKINGDEYHTLVREQQYDIITGKLLHVDFQVVSLTETVRTSVAIQFEGESPAVKGLNGVLVTGIEALDVEGLPQDLPSRILVDVTGLEELGDTLTVEDLSVPAKVKVLNEPEEMVVLVTGRDLEELEEEEEELIEEVEEPEVIERGRKLEEVEAEESEAQD